MLPHRKILYVFLALLICISCTIKLTDRQRVLWGLNVYQAQYHNYLKQVLKPETTAEQFAIFSADPSLITDDDMRPGITEEAWKVLRAKKAILVKMRPTVILAAELTEQNQVPDAELQEKMINYLNELLAIGE